MRILTTMTAASAVLASGLLAGCQPRDAQSTTDSAQTTPPSASAAPADSTHAGATAIVKDSTGRELGTLTLAEAGQGITVTGKLMHLAPGQHALHLHTTGKCEPPFTSAGGHWNPTNMQHGNQNPQGPHFGDMMNITVGPDSTAIVNESTPGGTLHGTNPLLDADGAAVVVHAGLDDYKSDPAGNAGGRVACGVVTAQ